MGWSRSEIRRDGRRGLHRLAPRRGAAGRRATRSLGVDSYTDYYERCAQGAERRRARRARSRSRRARRSSRSSRAPTASSTSPASRACARAGARASSSTSTGTCARRSALFEAAADAGVRVVFASSSSVYGDAETLPDAGGRRRRSRSRRTGSRSWRASSSPSRSGAARGLDAVVLRYFTVYGPRQRPDMAFTAMLEALARGERVPALRRRQRGAELHVRRRRGGGDDRRDGARPPRRDLQRRRRRGGDDERGDRARRGDLGTARSTSSAVEAAAGDVKRTKADVSKAAADLGWAPADRRCATGMAAQWEWASVESPA